jgi:hypothetical protein
MRRGGATKCGPSEEEKIYRKQTPILRVGFSRFAGARFARDQRVIRPALYAAFQAVNPDLINLYWEIGRRAAHLDQGLPTGLGSNSRMCSAGEECRMSLSAHRVSYGETLRSTTTR